VADADDELVDQPAASLDDVQMSQRDGVERTGVDGAARHAIQLSSVRDKMAATVTAFSLAPSQVAIWIRAAPIAERQLATPLTACQAGHFGQLRAKPLAG
jgi:hypothetical protein